MSTLVGLPGSLLALFLPLGIYHVREGAKTNSLSVCINYQIRSSLPFVAECNDIDDVDVERN